MKTLNEIKRNIIAFYSRIQDKVTDFAIGSVAHDIIFSMSASLEDVHREISEVEKQAYIATASGKYLDKLIDGTFQLPRTAATRSIGYVVVYGNSPLPNPGNIKLRYAEFDYETGEFVAGMSAATKFIGVNNQGDEGLVYVLINPRNEEALATGAERVIDLGGRNVQYLILPVASALTGSRSNVREGGITGFPSPPPGLPNVLNTSNPGVVFFSSGQAIEDSPFYSRFTEVMRYEDGKFFVVNAYNFSSRGYLEVSRDVNELPINATYSDMPIGSPGATLLHSGLIFEYIQKDTSVITLKNTVLGNPVPSITITDGTAVKTLSLRSFTYDGSTYPEGASYDQDLHNFLINTPGLVVQQRPDQINESLIFDPDNILTQDYRILPANMVAGGADSDTDEEYRQALRKYLNGLSRATPSALEAGALQIAGITYARTLPSGVSPRGSTILLVSNAAGVISASKRQEVKEHLDEFWKAAGVNLIVTSPEIIRTHISMVVKLLPGSSRITAEAQIRASVDNYLLSKNPGDSLKYSELLALIADISGVENVFNMLMLKNLTFDTYSLYQAEYNLAALEAAGGVHEVITESNNTLIVGGGVALVETTPGNFEYQSSPVNDSATIGLVYAHDGNDEYDIILHDDVPALASLYSSLTAAVTVDDFSAILLDNKNMLSVDDNTFMYLLSYLLSEPLGGTIPILPVDPETIQYQFVRDYAPDPTQLFRLGAAQTSATKVAPVVGVKFI